MRKLLCLVAIITTLVVASPSQDILVIRRPSAAEPLLTNLVASWKLSDLSDAVGSNTLTNNNTATFSTGLIGNAVYTASASSQYLSLAGTTADVKMGNIDFTIVADVYLATLPANSYSIVTKDVDTPGSSRDYTLDIQTDGVPQRIFRFYINGTIIAIDTTALSASTWYHVAAWHDASANTVNIQVNNATPVSTTTTGTAPQDSSAEFRIGARAYSGFEDYLNGRIDNVNIWKRALTAGERTRLYNGGASCEHPFSSCP